MSITFLTSEDKVLRYDAQTLTEDEKAQARTNIGAVGESTTVDVSDLYADKWVNKKPWGTNDTTSPNTFYADNNGAISIVEPIYTDAPLTIECTSSIYMFSYITWATPNGGYVSDSGWKTEKVTVPAGKYITMTMKINGGGTIAPDKAASIRFTQTKSLSGILYSLDEKANENAAKADFLSIRPCHPVVKSVAHRGFSGEAPENTLAAYRLAKKKGFEVVETDVYISKDNIPVLLHDLDVSRTTNGAHSGSVGSFTLEELKAMDFSYLFSDTYPNERIPTLEEFLILCRNLGLHPYLELRINNAALLVGIVKKCGMLKNVTWICSSDDYLAAIKAVDSTARLGLVAHEITAETIAKATALKTDDNEVFIDSEYSILTDEKVQMCIDADLPLEVWTINKWESNATTGKTIVQGLHPYVTGITTDDMLPWEVLYEQSMN